MDSNNMYQNQQTGTEPDNNQMGNTYQGGDAYQTGNTFQNGDTYQTGNAYQSNETYQNDSVYQQPVYNQNNGYNNGNYGNDSYNSGNGYNGGNYNGGNYSNGSYGGGYGNGGYQPYQQPSQLDLEEPVKMSEWLIAMLLMMVPCVNIVMMFVWAFSKTEKKSKSNFFKAQLIMAGVVFALYMVILIFAVAVGIMY